MALLNFRAVQALFLAKAEAKHAKSVPAYGRLKDLVEKRGGTWAGDHIALRTTDERVAELIKKAGLAMNLKRPAGEEDYPYRFPDKRLKSFDLLGEDHRDLKLFVSVWDESVTKDPIAAAAIREDRDSRYQAGKRYYDEVESLATKAVQQGGLEKNDAERFTTLFVDHVLTRNGAPLKQSTYDTVAKESGELASAMVLGEGINHFTVDVRKTSFASTEEMRLAAQKAGMKVLDKTSGREGWLLQSATVAEEEPITLLGGDGREMQAKAPLRFMEFIWRPEIIGKDGRPELLPDGTPKLYDRFEQANAANIFAAARVQSP